MWDLRPLSKLDLRLGDQLLSFRVAKIVCTWWILLSFFANSLEMLPLYCKTNCCFSVFFSCFTFTPALYLCLFCSFHLQLVNCILDNIPYPMLRILITFPNFFIHCQCFMERYSMLVARKRRCIVPCNMVFLCWTGTQLQKLRIVPVSDSFDTMCKKLYLPVVR